MIRSLRRPAIVLAIAVAVAGSVSTQPAWPPTIDAPAALASTARRLQQLDTAALERALARAGLVTPRALHVALVSEDDARARAVPAWVVGQAFGSERVRIFPGRVAAYPYDSLEAVYRHEVVHAALTATAGAGRLPRWFHEGVAVSVERGWGLTDNARLLLSARNGPALADLTRLFQSGRRGESAEAYRLATALVADLRRRHGADLPGRIAARVAAGATFDDAFLAETGESPEAAAGGAWATYRAASVWMPLLTRGASLWTAILCLATVSFVIGRRRRARQRRAWDETDAPG